MSKEKIVVIQLMGGVGNQLFQYSAARSLSIDLGAKLLIDLSWFAGDHGRLYELGKFNLPIAVINKIPQFPCGAGIFVHKLLRTLTIKKLGATFYNEPSFDWDPDLKKILAPVYLYGYFQSEKYFLPHEKTIRHDLKYDGPYPERCNSLIQRIGEVDSIALHVRRGDYLHNKNMNVYHTQSVQYYKKAITTLSKNLRNPYCFIFSDDSSWVKENLIFDIPFEIVDINSEETPFWDLMLMSKCKHFIIANSTFSWWSAWLGADPQKKVIAPINWFKSNRHVKDLLPSNWINL
jgi:Glycosyl transferase family 11